MHRKFFISFSSEDVEVADYISKTFNHIFHGKAEFFISHGGITSGEDWLRKLRKEIRSANSLLVVLNRRSVYHPWINIEIGAFWISGKAIYPLLHWGITPKDLQRPVSDYQATLITDPRSVSELIGSISGRLNLLSPPAYDAKKIAEDVNRLDGAIYGKYDNWHKLTSELEIATEEVPEDLSEYEVKVENPQLAYAIRNKTILEVSGFTKDSLILHLMSRRDISRKRFLIVKIENAANSISDDIGKCCKLCINNNLVLPYFDVQKHYDDKQYVCLDDGYYAYSLGGLEVIGNETEFCITIVFWKVRLSGLRLKLHLI